MIIIYALLSKSTRIFILACIPLLFKIAMHAVCANRPRCAMFTLKIATAEFKAFCLRSKVSNVDCVQSAVNVTYKINCAANLTTNYFRNNVLSYSV